LGLAQVQRGAGTGDLLLLPSIVILLRAAAEALAQTFISDGFAPQPRRFFGQLALVTFELAATILALGFSIKWVLEH